MSWDALWPSLAEGTEQVDQQDFYSDDPWPVPINSSPSHHSWMRCVRTVRIRDDFNDLDHFLFAQARNLRPRHLWCDMLYTERADAYDAFFSAPALSGLRSLCVWDVRAYLLKPEHITALVSSLGDGIQRLHLSALDSMGDHLAEQLARHRSASQLCSLDLTGTQLSNTGMTALARCGGLSGLRDLHVAGNAIDDQGVQALAQSPLLRGVERLFLHGNALGDAGAAALAQSPHVRNLTDLTVYDCRLGEAGFQAIDASPYLCAQLKAEIRTRAAHGQAAARVQPSD